MGPVWKTYGIDLRNSGRLWALLSSVCSAMSHAACSCGVKIRDSPEPKRTMTDEPPPDPLDRGQLAEAILAVERRVAVLEKERPIAKFGVSPARAWIMIFVVIAIAAIAFFWQPFAPKNYKQCAEDAAREAKTNGALGILLSACRDKFGDPHPLPEFLRPKL